MAGTYGALFGFQKPVQFSYAGDTCVRQLSLTPGMAKQTGDAGFDAMEKGGVSVGGKKLWSTSVCFTASKTPKAGTYTVAIAPFGGGFVAKKYAVTVPQAPTANVTEVSGKAISTALPLNIKLTSADTVHTYQLGVADKSAECAQNDGMLACPVSTLALVPGTGYDITLSRSFEGAGKQQVLKSSITTLTPLNLTAATVSDGKVLYDVPTDFRFTFDKEVASADVTLKKADGQAVDVTTKQEGTTVIVTPKAELPRKTEFTLGITQVVAENGSSLVAPLSYKLTTSGGPKVSNVSVGATGVAQTAKVTVTFDQPVAADTDVAKVARIGGVTGTVTKVSDTQFSFNINNAPLCSAFTLTVDKGLKSGSNSEVSEEAWTFKSRIVCGTSSVIGYSVKGRPIIAYYFGSGSSTILFTGGIHGSEGSSTTTMQSWVTYLSAHAAEVIPADKRVVVVPNTNPDGIAANSRYNANNVNLGRNFATNNWKANTETSAGIHVNGGGTSPTSEPESKALATLTRQLRPRLEVSFHASGRLVGANKFGDSVAIGNIYAKQVGYRTMFNDAEAVMGYPMTGENEDWMGESMNIPAILIELPSASGNYLSSQQAALIRMLSV